MALVRQTTPPSVYRLALRRFESSAACRPKVSRYPLFHGLSSVCARSGESARRLVGEKREWSSVGARDSRSSRELARYKFNALPRVLCRCTNSIISGSLRARLYSPNLFILVFFRFLSTMLLSRVTSSLDLQRHFFRVCNLTAKLCSRT